MKGNRTIRGIGAQQRRAIKKNITSSKEENIKKLLYQGGYDRCWTEKKVMVDDTGKISHYDISCGGKKNDLFIYIIIIFFVIVKVLHEKSKFSVQCITKGKNDRIK